MRSTHIYPNGFLSFSVKSQDAQHHSIVKASHPINVYDPLKHIEKYINYFK